jgi:hypothetical protein
VIVGPNNSGKTSTLREIRRWMRHKNTGPVLKEVAIVKCGEESDLNDWLTRNAVLITDETGIKKYCWLKASCYAEHAPRQWERSDFSDLGGMLCDYLSVDQRFAYLEPAKDNYVRGFNALTDSPPTPLHVIYANDDLEKRASRFFRKAFGVDLILNRGVGTILALHCGEPPVPGPGQDRVSRAYIEKLAALPELKHQGHGMRSFAGCLIGTVASPSPIHLIDEPEAFLYPSQARFLGRLLVTEKPEWRQLIIATHSGDLLRGILASEPENVNIIRLVRIGNTNHARQLPASQIREVWSNPILRYSNVLDGLFHESVVVCESDSDCRFYAAVLEAIQTTEETSPDVFFTTSGGKQRMPTVVGSLVSLGVTTRVVADFDVLRDDEPLRGIVEALGGDWIEIKPKWASVKAAIEKELPPLTRQQARQQIQEILSRSDDAVLNRGEIDGIRKAVRRMSVWDFAKQAGKAIVPAGAAQQDLQHLLSKLRAIGLFIVESGEIESFAPTIGLDGTRWVAEVLKRDLAKDAELESARRFVSDLFAIDAAGPAIPSPKVGLVQRVESAHPQVNNSAKPATERRSLFRLFSKRER